MLNSETTILRVWLFASVPNSPSVTPHESKIEQVRFCVLDNESTKEPFKYLEWDLEGVGEAGRTPCFESLSCLTQVLSIQSVLKMRKHM